jgi:hypothetical protein
MDYADILHAFRDVGRIEDARKHGQSTNMPKLCKQPKMSGESFENCYCELQNASSFTREKIEALMGVLHVQ